MTIYNFSHYSTELYPHSLFRTCNGCPVRNESSASITNKWMILLVLRHLWKLFLHLSICSSSFPFFLGDHLFYASGASRIDKDLAENLKIPWNSMKTIGVMNFKYTFM